MTHNLEICDVGSKILPRNLPELTKAADSEILNPWLCKKKNAMFKSELYVREHYIKGTDLLLVSLEGSRLTFI
jgi:hypothetical protein